MKGDIAAMIIQLIGYLIKTLICQVIVLVIFQAKMSNICFFGLLKYELIFLIYFVNSDS